MAKTRNLAKQELTRLNNNIDWCFKHIKTFLEMGYQEREEFLLPLQAIVISLESIKTIVDDVKNKV